MSSGYIAMFDEYNEDTAIAKAAENSSQRPTNQWFLALDADGVAVSSGFYLRLSDDAGRMLKGQIPLNILDPQQGDFPKGDAMSQRTWVEKAP